MCQIQEIFQPTFKDKFLTEIKLLTEIYRNIQTFTFLVFLECSSWASRNSAVQMFAGKSVGKFVK